MTDQPSFHCTACNWLYYFNPAVAVAGIIVNPDGLVLFLRRQKNPGKGKLGLPGGFVDVGETIEEALQRELLEEVNLTAASMEYLGSFTNEYHYRDLTYPVADLFFICRVNAFESIQAQASEVASFEFLQPTEKELDHMAFVSNRKALEAYLQR